MQDRKSRLELSDDAQQWIIHTGANLPKEAPIFAGILSRTPSYVYSAIYWISLLRNQFSSNRIGISKLQFRRLQVP